MISTEAKQALREYQDEIVPSALPGSVFHYTGTVGALGILRDESLWLSNARYLNDAQEIEFTRQLISRLCEDEHAKVAAMVAAHGETWSIVRDFLLRVRYLADVNSIDIGAYVACFCGDNNLLSQWRGYGNEGVGYAIGFDPAALFAAAESAFADEIVFFAPVRYDADEWLNGASKVCGAVIESLVSQASGLSMNAADALSEEHAIAIVREFLFHAPFVKHQGFAEEAEWRLVVLNPHPKGLHFRPSAMGLVPYLTMGTEAAIGSVMVGPSREPQLSVRSIKLLTSGRSIDVASSEIPLR